MGYNEAEWEQDGYRRPIMTREQIDVFLPLPDETTLLWMLQDVNSERKNSGEVW